MPITARDIAAGLNLIGAKEPPIALCPRCKGDEPLVMTFEMRGAEFHCTVCRGWFGFLDPRPGKSTPELMALHDEREARYIEERKAREATR